MENENINGLNDKPEEKIEEKLEDRNYREAILSAIRGDCTDELLAEILADYHDNDIASVFDELSSEELDRLNNALGSEAMSDIIAFLDDAGEVLSELDADDVADIIEQMDADEALEVLEDLDEETRNEVFELIEDEAKEDIELLDSYEDDEFGSVMSTNFIAIKRNTTVKGAMRALVAEAPENDNIYTLFVTEEDGSFYGTIDLKELIVARSDKPLEELIYTTFPYVYDKENISESIERLRGYSEDIIPVLSANGNKLLGVITSKDIIEIVDAERGDDYAKLAALTSEADTDDSLWKNMKKRIPWLAALLVLGLAVSAVVGLFEGVVKELPLIVCFQSLILGMAGNVGTQSLAVTVRTLGSEELSLKKQLGLIFKETRIALLNGFVIGIFSVAIVGGYLTLISGHPASLAFATAACVGIALCFSMMISGFTGATIPMCFYRLGIDPAIASGPLITTINDLVAVVGYYGLAWLLLLQLGIF